MPAVSEGASHMYTSQTGRWRSGREKQSLDLGKSACFPFKGKPRKKALGCHVWQEMQVKPAVTEDGGDAAARPHPEPEGLLGPPSSGSQHTCPLKM